MVVHCFFLEEKSADDPRKVWRAAAATYLVPQPHDSTRWRHSNEATWDESLNSSTLCSLSERNLVLLFRRTDTADDDIDSGQHVGERFLRALEIALANLYTSLLEGYDGRLLNRPGTDESMNFL